MKPITEKVEKWVARDGSLHDSEQDAERHTLRGELAEAIKAGLDSPGRETTPDAAAGHVLYHFEVWRKADAPPSRLVPPVVKTARQFQMGFLWGAAFASVWTTWVLY